MNTKTAFFLSTLLFRAILPTDAKAYDLFHEPTRDEIYYYDEIAPWKKDGFKPLKNENIIQLLLFPSVEVNGNRTVIKHNLSLILDQNSNSYPSVQDKVLALATRKLACPGDYPLCHHFATLLFYGLWRTEKPPATAKTFYQRSFSFMNWLWSYFSQPVVSENPDSTHVSLLDTLDEFLLNELRAVDSERRARAASILATVDAEHQIDFTAELLRIANDNQDIGYNVIKEDTNIKIEILPNENARISATQALLRNSDRSESVIATVISNLEKSFKYQSVGHSILSNHPFLIESIRRQEEMIKVFQLRSDPVVEVLLYRRSELLEKLEKLDHSSGHSTLRSEIALLSNIISQVPPEGFVLQKVVFEIFLQEDPRNFILISIGLEVLKNARLHPFTVEFLISMYNDEQTDLWVKTHIKNRLIEIGHPLFQNQNRVILPKPGIGARASVPKPIPPEVKELLIGRSTIDSTHKNSGLIQIPPNELVEFARVFLSGDTVVFQRDFTRYIDLLQPFNFDPNHYQGQVIYDLGCGLSEFVDVMNTVYSANAMGVDLIFHPLFGSNGKNFSYEKAKAIANERNLDWTKRLGASITNLSKIPSESADLMISIELFRYLPPQSLKMALSEVYRILKPTGKAFLYGELKATLKTLESDYSESYYQVMDERGDHILLRKPDFPESVDFPN